MDKEKNQILIQIAKRKRKFKVEHLKKENVKGWWKEVLKRLCGAESSSGKLTNLILVEGVEGFSPKELADTINEVFLEPLQE